MYCSAKKRRPPALHSSRHAARDGASTYTLRVFLPCATSSRSIGYGRVGEPVKQPTYSKPSIVGGGAAGGIGGGGTGGTGGTGGLGGGEGGAGGQSVHAACTAAREVARSGESSSSFSREWGPW